ncbi:hypothetical protein Tco_1400498 [Tanacetum coccineum]
MAVLESCPKHNMVAYLEKTEGNAEFHEIIDFLTRSSIHHALTISLVVSTTFVEQFWTSAKSKIINNVRHITAKVAGKPVSISEASIRSDLLFNDADGIDSLHNQAIFDAIQLMGYEGDLTSDPSLRPSPSTTIPDSIPESSGGNHGEDTLDLWRLRNAQDLGRTIECKVDEERRMLKNVLSTEDELSTSQQKVPTMYQNDQTEGGRDTQTTQTPTSTIFGDDETIAKVLLNMSQAKAVSRENDKGVEFKLIQKTKGKKKIEEEDESESDSDGIPEAEKKFKQLASDEEMARKLQEEWETEEEGKRLAEEEATNDALIRNYNDIKARIEADKLLAKRLQEQKKRAIHSRRKSKIPS